MRTGCTNPVYPDDSEEGTCDPERKLCPVCEEEWDAEGRAEFGLRKDMSRNERAAKLEQFRPASMTVMPEDI